MHSLIYKMVYIFILTASYSVIIYNICPQKLGKRSIGIFTLINYFVSFLIDRYIHDSLILIFMIISIIVYTFMEYRKVHYSIMITGLTIVIVALSDLTAGLVEITILNIKQSEVSKDPTLYLIAVILILINSFIISKVINKFIRKYSNFNFKKHLKHTLILISYLVVVVVFIVVFVNIYKENSQIGSKIILLYSIFVIYSFIVIIVLLYTSHKNIKKELEKEYREKEAAQFKEYTTELEVLTCDLRKFRHDYLNILKTLEGYIKLEDIKGLQEYFNDIVYESEVVLNKEDKCFMLLQYIKIDPLKSLIASKIINAQSLGIKIRIEITEDIDELSMKSIDICRIIGILLDNAIEAAVESEKREIKFAAVKNEDKIIFIIINSCSEETPPIYKIYEKNFSTKGPSRGLGLKTVREIISEKYSKNAFLNTKILHLDFIQELIINSKDSF